MSNPTGFDIANLIAIDTHVHIESEVEDNAADQAARKYSATRASPEVPTNSRPIIGRGKSDASSFPWTSALPEGRRFERIVADFAEENSDIAMAFASVDPTRGPEAVREARRLVARGVKGFKLHPPLQQFHANDRIAYPFYEVMAEARLPVIFHTGHSGIGTGMPGGGGVRLKYGNPMDIDDVAVDFPDMKIIMAHPSHFPGRMRLSQSACTSRRFTSICRAGLPNISRRS